MCLFITLKIMLYISANNITSFIDLPYTMATRDTEVVRIAPSPVTSSAARNPANIAFLSDQQTPRVAKKRGKHANGCRLAKEGQKWDGTAHGAAHGGFAVCTRVHMFGAGAGCNNVTTHLVLEPHLHMAGSLFGEIYLVSVTAVWVSVSHANAKGDGEDFVQSLTAPPTAGSYAINSPVASR